MSARTLVCRTAICLAFLLWAVPAGAAPIDDTTGLDLAGLASFFADDGVAGNYTGINSTIDVYAHQDPAERFLFQGPLAGAWLLEVDYPVGYFEFGLYNAGVATADLDDDDLLRLFVGSTLLPLTSRQGSVAGILNATPTTFAASVNPLMIPTADTADPLPTFGFYVTTGPAGNRTTMYSESDRNPGGVDRFLVYHGRSTDLVTINGFSLPDDGSLYIAVDLDGDKDFDDTVVRARNMAPVPEPATLFLLGTGLAGLAGISRRRWRRDQ